VGVHSTKLGVGLAGRRGQTVSSYMLTGSDSYTQNRSKAIVGVLIPGRNSVCVRACDHDQIWAYNLKARKSYTGSGPGDDPVKTLLPVWRFYYRERVRCSNITMVVARLSC
jgi:hypothetical protein